MSSNTLNRYFLFFLKYTSNGDMMKKFIILLLLTFGIAIIPTLFIDFDVSKFTQPPLFPPKILFPIVWSILYLLMTISQYISTKNDDEVYKIYFAQLIVNALWSPLFFGLNAFLVAFIWLVLLVVLVIKMIFKMKEKNEVAAYLQIPYFIWLLFAGYLNFAIYILN